MKLTKFIVISVRPSSLEGKRFACFVFKPTVRFDTTVSKANNKKKSLAFLEFITSFLAFCEIGVADFLNVVHGAVAKT
jgi:hypothetical protein